MSWYPCEVGPDDFAPHAKANIEVEAVVIRADGTRIPLGVVDASYELDPERELRWRLFGKAEADKRIGLVNTIHERTQ